MDRIIRFSNIVEKNGDVFKASGNYCLAHCVAEDLKMNQGIAVTFKQKYGNVNYLRHQKAKTGDIAVLKRAGVGKDRRRFVYYLVTKRSSYGKPNYHHLKLALLKLRDHCLEHSVYHLAMPKIGCGLDKLKWYKVESILKEVFHGTYIRVNVYTFQPSVAHHYSLPRAT